MTYGSHSSSFEISESDSESECILLLLVSKAFLNAVAISGTSFTGVVGGFISLSYKKHNLYVRFYVIYKFLLFYFM